MIKTRLIGVVPVLGGIAVQSIGFRKFLPIGMPEIAINYLDRWGIDEIVVLHIDRDPSPYDSRGIDRVRSYARNCQVPLAVGGGIRDLEAVKRIIQAGADKVVVNSIVAESPDLIGRGAELFGAQCIVAAIDVRREAGQHWAYVRCGSRPTGLSPLEMAGARSSRRGPARYF